MKFVKIYKIQNDGTQRVAVTCKIYDETVVCEGDEVLIENLEREGVWDDSVVPPKKLFPKDGIKFLERLRFTFASGYLNASEVKEE
jgi:hypothetical protein